LTDRELDELLEELRAAVQSRIDHFPDANDAVGSSARS
jgi:hypothetical protein